MTDPSAAPTTGGTTVETTDVDDLAEDSLVEEISIDGMCGVY
ncbi:MAG: hypothetical protein JWR42_1260 [Marmoricola sp.]|nr:hypothetical protein [Marmoricola sp.]